MLISTVRPVSTVHMTSCLTVPMARKVAPVSPPICRSKTSPRKMNDTNERGFTLLEMVCVLAIIALLAAVLLPIIPHETSRSRLQAYALEAAALLKADRNAAIRHQTSVATVVDAEARAIRSGSSQTIISVPNDVRFDALLPQTCRERTALSTISFFANGTSCGGAIALTRLGTGYEVRVNWLTGGIEIVSHDISN